MQPGKQIALRTIIRDLLKISYGKESQDPDEAWIPSITGIWRTEHFCIIFREITGIPYTVEQTREYLMREPTVIYRGDDTWMLLEMRQEEKH